MGDSLQRRNTKGLPFLIFLITSRKMTHLRHSRPPEKAIALKWFKCKKKTEHVDILLYNV